MPEIEKWHRARVSGSWSERYISCGLAASQAVAATGSREFGSLTKCREERPTFEHRCSLRTGLPVTDRDGNQCDKAPGLLAELQARREMMMAGTAADPRAIL